MGVGKRVLVKKNWVFIVQNCFHYTSICGYNGNNIKNPLNFERVIISPDNFY